MKKRAAQWHALFSGMRGASARRLLTALLAYYKRFSGRLPTPP